MKNKYILTSFALLLIAGGAMLIYTSLDKAKPITNSNNSSTSPATPTNAEQQSNPSQQAARQTTPSQAIHLTNYITVADYNANKSMYADARKVYFFHATWCPICQSIDKAVSADPSKLPEKVVLIKADFDKELDLRKKYGITQQYTFVEFDSQDKQVSKWLSTSFDDLIKTLAS